jgi:hypothetical protein
MTSRDHARRLLLVLLANERREMPVRERTGPARGAAVAEATVPESGAGTDAPAEVRDADGDRRMWASSSPAAWGATRTS